MRKPYCLVLDKRFYPFLIVNYKKAFLMSLRESNTVLEYHPTEFLHTVNRQFPVPVIIQVDEIIDHKAVYVTPTRQLILIRDDYTCQYCGRNLTDRSATIDHVVPKSQGGQWSWHNLVACCEKCNQAKGNQIWQPMNKPKRPEPFIITFKRIINVVDLQTFDIWLRYLPIKLRRIAINMHKERDKIIEKLNSTEV